MRKYSILLISILLLYSFAVIPVSAQSSETNVSDINKWISLDGGEQYAEEVEEWVNSNSSNEYPNLKEEAEVWLSDKESSGDYVDTDNMELSGSSKQISQDVTVTGYEFDYQNETVTFTLRVDSVSSVVFQDVGATVSGGGFDYRSERLRAGEYAYEIDAQLFRSEYQQLQRIAIIDASNQQVNTLSYVHSTVFLESAEVWMVPFSILVGAFSLIGLSIVYVNNKKEDGVGEFKPLE